jgi:hypothetical protein
MLFAIVEEVIACMTSYIVSSGKWHAEESLESHPTGSILSKLHSESIATRLDCGAKRSTPNNN